MRERTMPIGRLLRLAIGTLLILLALPFAFRSSAEVLLGAFSVEYDYIRPFSRVLKPARRVLVYTIPVGSCPTCPTAHINYPYTPIPNRTIHISGDN